MFEFYIQSDNLFFNCCCISFIHLDHHVFLGDELSVVSSSVAEEEHEEEEGGEYGT